MNEELSRINLRIQVVFKTHRSMGLKQGFVGRPLHCMIICDLRILHFPWCCVPEPWSVLIVIDSFVGSIICLLLPSLLCLTSVDYAFENKHTHTCTHQECTGVFVRCFIPVVFVVYGHWGVQTIYLCEPWSEMESGAVILPRSSRQWPTLLPDL